MRPTAEPPAALPYDLAFDIREFLWSSTRFYARLLPTETDRRSMGHVISEWTRPNAVDAAQRIVEFIRAHVGPPKAGTITPEFTLDACIVAAECWRHDAPARRSRAARLTGMVVERMECVTPESLA